MHFFSCAVFLNAIKLKYHFRMLTSSKESATGAVFHNSPSDSDFQQVYKKNMDDKSYLGAIPNIIQGALSNPNSAVFETEVTIEDTEEYKSCQVLRYSTFLQLETSLF